MPLVSFQAPGNITEIINGRRYDTGESRPYTINVPENASKKTKLDVRGPSGQVVYSTTYETLLGQGKYIPQNAQSIFEALTPVFEPGLNINQALQKRAYELSDLPLGVGMSGGTYEQQRQMGITAYRALPLQQKQQIETQEFEKFSQAQARGELPGTAVFNPAEIGYYGGQSALTGYPQTVPWYQQTPPPSPPGTVGSTSKSGNVVYTTKQGEVAAVWNPKEQTVTSVPVKRGNIDYASQQSLQPKKFPQNIFGEYLEQRPGYVEPIGGKEWAVESTGIIGFPKKMGEYFGEEFPIRKQVLEEVLPLPSESYLYSGFGSVKINPKSLVASGLAFPLTGLKTGLAAYSSFGLSKKYSDFFLGPEPEVGSPEWKTEQIVGSTRDVQKGLFDWLALEAVGFGVLKGAKGFKTVKPIGEPSFFPTAKTKISLKSIDSDLIGITLKQTGKGLLETPKLQKMFASLFEKKIVSSEKIGYKISADFVIKADKAMDLKSIAGVPWKKVPKPIQEFVLEKIVPQDIVSKKVFVEIAVGKQKPRFFDVSTSARVLPKDLVKQDIVNVFSKRGKKMVSVFGEPSVEFGESIFKKDIGLKVADSFGVQGNWDLGLQPSVSVVKSNLTARGFFSSIAQEVRPSWINKFSFGKIGKAFKPKGKPETVAGEFDVGIVDRELITATKGFDFFGKTKSFSTMEVFKQIKRKGNIFEKKVLDIAVFEKSLTKTSKNLVKGTSKELPFGSFVKVGSAAGKKELAAGGAMAEKMVLPKTEPLKFGEKQSLSEWAKTTYGENAGIVEIQSGKQKLVQITKQKTKTKMVSVLGTESLAGPLAIITKSQAKTMPFSYAIPGSAVALAEGLTTRIVSKKPVVSTKILFNTRTMEVPPEFGLNPREIARQQLTPMQKRELKLFSSQKSDFGVKTDFALGSSIKSLQEQFQKSELKRTQKDMVKSLQAQFSQSAVKQSQKQMVQTLQAQKAQVLTRQQSLLKQQSLFRISQKSLQLQSQRQLQKQMQKQAQRTMQIQIPIQKITPRVIPVTWQLPSQQASQQSFNRMFGGFAALVKRGGKWYKLGTRALSSQQAMRLGAGYSEQTLGRSFKIGLANIKLPTIPVPRGISFAMPDFSRFYRGKQGAWIEKTGFAINVPGEKGELASARRLKKLLKGF